MLASAEGSRNRLYCVDVLPFGVTQVGKYQS